MSWVLGVGGFSHDASAALVHEGKLVAAVQEERLTRIKHVGGFPYEAIRFCLNHAGITIKDVAAVAFYTKRSNWDWYLRHSVKAALLRPKHTLTAPRDTVLSVGLRLYRSLTFRAELERFLYETGLERKRFSDHDHHACHAASAYYPSPFDEALILCVDGGGDGRTTTAWVGRGTRLKQCGRELRHPHSLGVLYTRVTRYLGFGSPGDEYKVMGLAAYGKPVHLGEMRAMVEFRPDGLFRLNPDFFRPQFEYSLTPRFYEAFGPARAPGEKVEQRHADMAASVQALYEELLLHFATTLKKQTGIKRLALSGGSALNCRANGRLLSGGEFDEIYVPPAAGDLGTSIGAAQYHYYERLAGTQRWTLPNDGHGPEYTDEQIERELVRASVKYEKVSCPAETAAELIARGKIVGWFQGRMEFGPRALGYRSILADPRTEAVKDYVNQTIKFREEFRPFAPSVLREHVKSYFGIDVSSPYMTFTLDTLPEKRREIPAVVHVDGSARVQTVSSDDQPQYYALIEHFYRRTGIPVVLNTSFNLAGEPIVCSPYDALRTFYTCGLDALVMGRYLLLKDSPAS